MRERPLFPFCTRVDNHGACRLQGSEWNASNLDELQSSG